MHIEMTTSLIDVLLCCNLGWQLSLMSFLVGLKWCQRGGRLEVSLMMSLTSSSLAAAQLSVWRNVRVRVGVSWSRWPPVASLLPPTATSCATAPASDARPLSPCKPLLHSNSVCPKITSPTNRSPLGLRPEQKTHIFRPIPSWEARLMSSLNA